MITKKQNQTTTTYRHYKTPFLIDSYPPDSAWVVNRYLYLTKLERDNPMLDIFRKLYAERWRIEKEYRDEYLTAWDLMFDNFDPFVPEREEKMPYLEVKDEY